MSTADGRASASSWPTSTGTTPKLIWSRALRRRTRAGARSAASARRAWTPAAQQTLIRVSHTTAQGGELIFTHETWLLRLDGSENKLFIPYSFNAVWKPSRA